MRPRPIIVCGIGTEVGKTITAAIFVSITGYDYWKPVQAGNLDHTDAETVRKLSSHPVHIHPEACRLSHACSPHLAAQREGMHLPSFFSLPTSQSLVIEMSGGVMVPINEQSLLIDACLEWNCDWVLVSRHYIGSINHTLLSVEYLKKCGCPLLGIVFNGYADKSTEDFILKYTGVPCIGTLKQEPNISPTIIQTYADLWKHQYPYYQKINDISGILSHKQS
jgi:dethiobiotin synthetase